MKYTKICMIVLKAILVFFMNPITFADTITTYQVNGDTINSIFVNGIYQDGDTYQGTLIWNRTTHNLDDFLITAKGFEYSMSSPSRYGWSYGYDRMTDVIADFQTSDSSGLTGIYLFNILGGHLNYGYDPLLRGQWTESHPQTGDLVYRTVAYAPNANIPEPDTIALLCLGFLGLAYARRSGFSSFPRSALIVIHISSQHPAGHPGR